MNALHGCKKVMPLLPARFATRSDLPYYCQGVQIATAFLQRFGVSNNASNKEAKVFYKWPAIKHCRLLSRWKLYQVALMALFLPPATLSYQHGSLAASTLLSAYIAAGGTLAILLSLSHLFTRVVGEMAYLPARHQVRVSTLTFLGGRADLLVAPEEILSQGDGGRLLQRLELAGSKKVYLYSLQYGHVLDTHLMNDLLMLNR